MWERWQRGESLHKIARLFDRHHSSVRRILAETGGIRPATRHRADGVLTLAEREEISRGFMAGQSIRAVPGERGASGVARNDLPKSLHPSARSLEKELLEHLRHTRAMRRSRHHTQ